MKQDGAATRIRESSAAMMAAWKPPPLVPVMLMRAESTSGRVEQIVERPHAIPHFPARDVGAGEVGEVAQDGVLATNQVITALPGSGVPELASLALAHGIPADHDVPTRRQPLAHRLIVGLAVGRVAGCHQHRRMVPPAVVRDVHQGRHEDPRQTFEDDFLDVKTGHLDLTRDLRIERRARRGQAPQHPQQLRAQFALQSQQVRFRADAAERSSARVVLTPGHFGLVCQVRRDARTIRLTCQHGEGLRRRRCRRLTQRAEGCEHKGDRYAEHQT